MAELKHGSENTISIDPALQAPTLNKGYHVNTNSKNMLEKELRVRVLRRYRRTSTNTLLT